MTNLRRRMLEDMQLRGYAERTRESYANAVGGLARHYGRPPDQLGEDDIRNFFLHLINERKSARSTLVIYLTGIKFFFEKTLGRKWKVFGLLLPPKSKKLPAVLAKKEVETIIGKVRNATIKMVLTLQKIERRILKNAIFRQRTTARNFRDLRQITPSNPFANRPQSRGKPGIYLAGGYLVLDLPGRPPLLSKNIRQNQ